MAVSTASQRAHHAPARAVHRRLLLIWQNPETREFIHVGHLDELVDGKYAFAYTEGAHSDGFYPLAQFPELERAYVARALPAFFVNRVMSRRRDSYPDYLQAIGIDYPELETPMEILARTGGPRATDTFHLVDEMCPDPSGLVVSRFLASGIRHVAGSDRVLRGIHDGDRLQIVAEPGNEVNPRAQLICVSDGRRVGYVPNWLLGDLAELRRRSSQFDVYAERVTPVAHPHLRLLCRIEATVPAEQ